uniref:DNA-(apurinic or apyrimidinic site) endonuclease n=1 Tax=Hypsibius dujardini TaxID=232323 RepID=A0A0U2RGJ9_HYPDU|nr:putative recombination repair protein 1 [Hypsibius dujardini]
MEVAQTETKEDLIAPSSPVSKAGISASPTMTDTEAASAEKPKMPSPTAALVEASKKRSNKRKSILPDNLHALRASFAKTEDISVSPSPDGSVLGTPDRSTSTETVIPVVTVQPPAPSRDHVELNVQEPIAKRLRIRGTEKPAYVKPTRTARKARSESVDKATSLPPADSPVSDFDFTGLGVRSDVAAHKLPATAGVVDEVAPLKGILKHGYAPSAKQLAFIDEGVEERQALAESRRVEMEAVPAAAAPNPNKGVELLPGRAPNLLILSWNIAGLKAFVEKHTWREINTLLPDIICLQETKIQNNDVFESLGISVGTSHAYWHPSLTKGHAGVAILSKIKPIAVTYGLTRPDGRTFAEKGHAITAEYQNFFLINAYVPNSSAQLKNLTERLEWDKDFRAYIAQLQTKKPVVIGGDLNVALEEIDLSNPKRSTKLPGFTPQERESLALTIKDEKLVDVFRHLNPDKPGCYTFWSVRTNSRPKNVGWDVTGSDHCPIMLYLET